MLRIFASGGVCVCLCASGRECVCMNASLCVSVRVCVRAWWFARACMPRI